MNYLLRNKHDKKQSKNSTFFILLLFIFLLLVSIFFGDSVSKIFISAGHNLWSGSRKSSQLFQDIFSGIFNKVELSERVREYEIKEIEWSIKDVQFSNLQNKIKDYEAVFGLIDDKDKYIISGVLSIPPYSPFDYIIIDRGESSGVRKEKKVYSRTGFLLGEVSDTYSNYSKVKLFSQSNNKILVKFGTSTPLYEAIGRGGGEFSTVVPKDSNIKEKDAVLFPGISGDIIGFVSKIDNDNAKVFDEVFFQYPLPLSLIDFVIIEK